MNIVLIGFRGSGKSTLGRAVAARLGRRFVDLDDVIQARMGAQSISAIWREFGEARWRAEESAAMADVLAESNLVIAPGGGAPMSAPGRDLMVGQRDSGRAVIVYLRCRPTVLKERLRAATGDRPSLTGGSIVDDVEEILPRREPTYLALATLVFDNDADEPEAAADRLVAELRALSLIHND